MLPDAYGHAVTTGSATTYHVDIDASLFRLRPGTYTLNQARAELGEPPVDDLRRATALKLRADGANYADIADQLGYRSHIEARLDVQAALNETRSDDGDDGLAGALVPVRR